MHSSAYRFAPGDRASALAELADELTAFSYDGLVQLLEDLSAHRVARGSWDDCVLSYRCGRAGSVRCDQRGRRRTAFTVLWDCGGLTDEDVATHVRHALRQRAITAGGARDRRDAPPALTRT